MAWPTDGRVTIKSLGNGAGKVNGAQLLGSRDRLEWQQTPEGLVIDLPAERPCQFAWCLRVSGKGLRAAQ
jgi:alpha-L-fucosidase